MKKKNGFNIMLFVFIIILIMIFSCTKNTKRTVPGTLLQTDRNFSAMSVKEGMHKAFLFYIADSGVLLRNNSYPLKSRKSLDSIFEKSSDSSFILTWEPTFEKLSETGDLGYTFGIFTSKIVKTGDISKGTYVTIWEKQKDGSWKFVLDTGTQGLPDNKE
jgi:ketosteroid isomerase-like protein